MKKLYEAMDRIEAQMLKDELENAGVEAVILGDFLAGAAGELPANIWPAVWVVLDRDFARAEQILAVFIQRNEQQQQAGAWRCAQCGEWVDGIFDLCWNCATPRKQQQ
ncbi:MAG: DUF2007 domain-containing protein [Chromatiales bacterium]|jgi:hypothetical protein